MMRYITALLLSLALSLEIVLASDLSADLSEFRVLLVRTQACETILLSKEEQMPRSNKALASNAVKRFFIREGDKFDGNMVVEVDKTNRTAKLQKDGKILPLNCGPSGVQTNLWADLISTANDSVYKVQIGDRLADEWTIVSIDTNLVVKASNATGRIVVISADITGRKITQEEAKVRPNKSLRTE